MVFLSSTYQPAGVRWRGWPALEIMWWSQGYTCPWWGVASSRWHRDSSQRPSSMLTWVHELYVVSSACVSDNTKSLALYSWLLFIISSCLSHIMMQVSSLVSCQLSISDNVYVRLWLLLIISSHLSHMMPMLVKPSFMLWREPIVMHKLALGIIDSFSLATACCPCEEDGWGGGGRGGAYHGRDWSSLPTYVHLLTRILISNGILAIDKYSQ